MSADEPVTEPWLLQMGRELGLSAARLREIRDEGRKPLTLSQLQRAQALANRDLRKSDPKPKPVGMSESKREQLRQRNQRILARREAGATLKALGQEFGLHPNHCALILRKMRGI